MVSQIQSSVITMHCIVIRPVHIIIVIISCRYVYLSKFYFDLFLAFYFALCQNCYLLGYMGGFGINPIYFPEAPNYYCGPSQNYSETVLVEYDTTKVVKTFIYKYSHILDMRYYSYYHIIVHLSIWGLI